MIALFEFKQVSFVILNLISGDVVAQESITGT